MNPYSFTSHIRPDYRPHHESMHTGTGDNWLDSALSRRTYWLVQAVGARLFRRVS